MHRIKRVRLWMRGCLYYRTIHQAAPYPEWVCTAFRSQAWQKTAAQLTRFAMDQGVSGA